jgi:hypothetical protein
VRLSPLGTAATTGLLYQPEMIDDGDCGKIGGIKLGRGNRSTRRKPAPAPLYAPQIPHDQTRARTRAAAVGSQRLTAWAMARPSSRLVGLKSHELSYSSFVLTLEGNYRNSCHVSDTRGRSIDSEQTPDRNKWDSSSQFICSYCLSRYSFWKLTRCQ